MEQEDEDVFIAKSLIDDDVLFLDDMKVQKPVASRLTVWKRPDVPSAYEYRSSRIVFQQLEIESVLIEGYKAATINIYGITIDGNSVCCHVFGFKPYFYISCSQCISSSRIEFALEKKMSEVTGKDKSIISVERADKKSIMYYQKDRSQYFYKVVVALPSMVATCREILEKEMEIYQQGTHSFMTHESDVPFVLRFMIDCNIRGGNWIEVPAHKWKKTKTDYTYSQFEFDCLYTNLISRVPEGEYSKMGPFRILSFAIECAGRKGVPLDAKRDHVIQISNLVTLQGEEQPFVRNVMILNPCSPIPDVDVISCDNREQTLLLTWKDFVRVVDPDIIIGYNISNFDLPYLIERAETLGIPAFSVLGRIRNKSVYVKDAKFSSRQYGKRASKEVRLEGRVQFNLLQAMQRDYKLRSYSPSYVSAYFLNEQKEFLDLSIKSRLQNADDLTRQRLAKYCLKDAYLAQRLFDKLMFIYNYVEMARVTGVPLSFVLSRGQNIKVLSLLLRKATQRGLVLPNVKQAGSEQGICKGANVSLASAGFYKMPVATLDFESLYPSIMIKYNLCYSTLVTAEDVQNLSPEHVNSISSHNSFVTSDLNKGVLPEILEQLLADRRRAKADMKEANDPLVKAVLDGRQLALKISANSVYGFTGATVGQLPLLGISSFVTSCGREIFGKIKKIVEDKFTILGGYQHNAVVIYGDTDSVMVQFGVSNVEEAMKLGREASNYISDLIKPTKLECEKVYFPYLLINKKRYAALLWTNHENFDKMDTKGIETVRRENCLLVNNLVKECLERILINKDIDGAVKLAKDTISDLFKNRLDLYRLVISKGLPKTRTAQNELAERMGKDGAATVRNVVDQEPYVIIKTKKGGKVGWQRSEDPIHALENRIPLDPRYYLDNLIKKPLLGIFEPIIGNASRDLFHGDHIISTPSTNKSCIGCTGPISNQDQKVCSNCKGNDESGISWNILVKVIEIEDLHKELLTQCQKCQGSSDQDVLCTSRDCPIYYRRRECKKLIDELTN